MSTYSRGYNAARIGIVGLISVAAFIVLFLYVTDRGFAVTRPSVFVRFSSVGGLRKGDPVMYRGVEVGSVGKLIFTPEGDVLVHAKLGDRLPLTTDAKAELVAVDLFGRQALLLRDGTRFAPRLEGADTIDGAAPASMPDKMNELGGRAGRLIGDTTVMLLHQTLAGTAAATKQMATLTATIGKLVAAQQASVTALTEQAAQVAHNLNVATSPEQLVETRASLRNTTAHLDSATAQLTVLLASVQNGEGSLGKLMRDDGIFNHTDSLLISLDDLVRDFKANPKKYINVKIF